ncbi:MAG: hypothetical protein FWE07_06375 [Turicibacter sp.]|nr:hypothetical protein [Turicibacter sp.]
MKQLDGHWQHQAYYLKDTSENRRILSDLKEKRQAFNFVTFDELLAIYSNATENSAFLLLESDYMERQDHFNDICEKLSVKKYEEPLFLYDDPTETDFIEVDVADEVAIYEAVLAANNLDMKVEKSKLRVSVNVFELLRRTERVKWVQNIYVLLFLANSSAYEKGNFIFSVRSEKSEEPFELRLSFMEPEGLRLYPLYDWVVNDELDTNAYQTKLKVVREVVAKVKSFSDVEGLLEKSKSAFNRIISDKTENYFEQVNRLKDDFLTISNSMARSYKAVHTQMIGWLAAVAIYVYSEVSQTDDQNDLWVRLFCASSSERAQVVLAMLLLALGVIIAIFCRNIYQNKQEYRQLKKFYTDTLYFTDENFEGYIKAPRVEWPYRVLLGVLVVLVLVRLVLAFL